MSTASAVFAGEEARFVIQVVYLEEKKGLPTILAKGKCSVAGAQPVAKMVSPSEEKKLVSPSEEKKLVSPLEEKKAVVSCAISLMD